MILVVVCHPDDETIWFGGSLHALSKITEVNVICLSGRDENSPREAEFQAARKVAGYNHGIVLGFPLRKALQKLPNIANTVEEGLRIWGRTIKDVNLLVTHSPYGDEHQHPHHKQAFNELLKWTKKVSIPFSFFSAVQLPTCSHRSLMKNLPRSGPLHITNLSRCTYSLRDFFRESMLSGSGWMPSYYSQWQTDIYAKKNMLECYQSIGLRGHAQNYAMFTSCIESIYFMDKRGFKVIYKIIRGIEVPGVKDLFWRQTLLRIAVGKIWKRFRNALHN